MAVTVRRAPLESEERPPDDPIHDISPAPCCSRLALGFLTVFPAAHGQEKTPDTLVVTLPAPPADAASQPAWNNATDSNSIPDETRRPSSNGLIWKASSPHSTIYLLGSIHVASRDMYPLATTY